MMSSECALVIRWLDCVNWSSENQYQTSTYSVTFINSYSDVTFKASSGNTPLGTTKKRLISGISFFHKFTPTLINVTIWTFSACLEDFLRAFNHFWTKTDRFLEVISTFYKKLLCRISRPLVVILRLGFCIVFEVINDYIMIFTYCKVEKDRNFLQVLFNTDSFLEDWRSHWCFTLKNWKEKWWRVRIYSTNIRAIEPMTSHVRKNCSYV